MKSNPQPVVSDVERGVEIRPFAIAAPARRGHSGDQAYLQGCDLLDPTAEYDDANRSMVAASATLEQYDASWREAYPDRDYAMRAFEGSNEQVIKARYEADQRARGLLSEASPQGDLGSAILNLRMVNLCAVDLPNSKWLQDHEAWKLFETSNDRDVLNGLFYLAMHADDRLNCKLGSGKSTSNDGSRSVGKRSPAYD